MSWTQGLLQARCLLKKDKLICTDDKTSSVAMLMEASGVSDGRAVKPSSKPNRQRNERM